MEILTRVHMHFLESDKLLNQPHVSPLPPGFLSESLDAAPALVTQVSAARLMRR
jgi:hypothetical protein